MADLGDEKDSPDTEASATATEAYEDIKRYSTDITDEISKNGFSFPSDAEISMLCSRVSDILAIAEAPIVPLTKTHYHAALAAYIAIHRHHDIAIIPSGQDAATALTTPPNARIVARETRSLYQNDVEAYKNHFNENIKHAYDSTKNDINADLFWAHVAQKIIIDNAFRQQEALINQALSNNQPIILVRQNYKFWSPLMHNVIWAVKGIKKFIGI